MTRTEFIQKIVAETNSERVDVDINYAVQRADALEKSGAAPWDDAPGQTYKQGLADGNAEGLALGQKDSRRWIADALGAERETVARIAENSGLIDFAATLRGRTFIMAESADPLSAVKVELVKIAVRVEREACAKLCDEITAKYKASEDFIGWKLNATGSAACGDAIRARDGDERDKLHVNLKAIGADLKTVHVDGTLYTEDALRKAVELEREACAIIAMATPSNGGASGAIAAKIRARGNP